MTNPDPTLLAARLDVLERRVDELELRLAYARSQPVPPANLDELERFLERQAAVRDSFAAAIPDPGPPPPAAPGSTSRSSSAPSSSLGPSPTTADAPGESKADAAPAGVQGGPARADETGLVVGAVCEVLLEDDRCLKGTYVRIVGVDDRCETFKYDAEPLGDQRDHARFYVFSAAELRPLGREVPR